MNYSKMRRKKLLSSTALVMTSVLIFAVPQAKAQTVILDGGAPVASPLTINADTSFDSIVLTDGALIDAAAPANDLIVGANPSTIDVTGTGTISADIRV